MKIRLLMIFALLALAIGCAGLQPIEDREKIYGKEVPVITNSYASKEIRPGDTWKIYLIASDADGDMKNIICTIDQPGVGVYPVSFTKIKEENGKELSGYLYLNTLVVNAGKLNYVKLTLKIQIEDKSGHFSEPAVFPLSFNSHSTQEAPPKGVFQEKDLGPIMVTLQTIQDWDD